jgi:predicted ArsR family transcriptional regulator
MPSPPEFELTEGFSETLAAEPADERVYRVALQLYDPARIAEIADRADCAPDTARRHLRRLADIGVLDVVSEEPVTYRRNESYFEWRKQNRLDELSTEELQQRLEELTARERQFRETYDTDGPDAVDALAHADYDDLEAVWMDLSEWKTVRRRIERLETVRKRRSGNSAPGSEAA